MNIDYLENSDGTETHGRQESQTSEAPSPSFVYAVSQLLETDPDNMLIELGYSCWEYPDKLNPLQADQMLNQLAFQEALAHKM